MFVGNEADILTLGLGRRAEIEVGGDRSDVGLCHCPHRQEQTPQNQLVDHMKYVGLVLGAIDPTRKSRAARRVEDTGVMPSGDPIETQRVGSTNKSVELEVPITFDTRVGRSAGRMVANVGTNHVAFEVFAKVEHVVLDTKPVGDSTGIVDIAHRTTTGVGRPAPEFHGDADDLVAGVEQQRSGDRRINTARHHHEYRFA